MSQYCDSKVLERNWFQWIVSSATPELDPFRNAGILWTKIVGTVKKDDGSDLLKNGKPLDDPSYPTRSHCLAFGHPIYFNSYNGKPQSSGLIFVDEESRSIEIKPLSDELHLLSDSWVHNFDQPLNQQTFIPHIEVNKYFKEMASEVAWHAILSDIDKMCQGIAMNFKQGSEEERMDLANEALLQVTNKLVNKKLVYTPGRAPVFNLLTTTIFRCMYSIMNRRNNRKRGQARLLEEAEAGILPNARRSLRIPKRRPIKSN